MIEQYFNIQMVLRSAVYVKRSKAVLQFVYIRIKVHCMPKCHQTNWFRDNTYHLGTRKEENCLTNRLLGHFFSATIFTSTKNLDALLS